MNIFIINGPNINLIGKREPEIYGNTSFEDYFKTLQEKYSNINLQHFQSNVEGEIINYLHQIGFDDCHIIINPGAYAHTSVAIGDAIKAIASPVLEIHISNIYARENYRQISLTAANCIGVITGFGLKGYEMGVAFFLNHFLKPHLS